MTARRLATAALVGVAALLGAASVAHADYTASFCGTEPAPPWIEAFHASQGLPGGTGAGGCEFLLDSTDYLQPNSISGVGFLMPSGVTLSHFDVTWNNISQTPTTSNAYITWGASSLATNPPDQAYQWYLKDTVGATQEVSPDVTGGGEEFWGQIFCSSDMGTGCGFATNDVLNISRIVLTLHDTTTPVASATGGTLTTPGTVSGSRSLAYRASSGGSGVARVTLALGSTIVATATSNCPAAGQLAPCPAVTSGSFSIDTDGVPDGTYPVVLTAYDASGDAAPTRLGNVTIANHLTTLGNPRRTAPTGARGPHRRRVDVRARIRWTFVHARTEFARIRFLHPLPPNTRVTLTCAGRGCPLRRVSATRRNLRLFLAALHGRQFRSGDRLTLSFTRPHHRPERVRMTMRAHRTPSLKVLVR